MINIELKKGKEIQTLTLPKERLMGILEPAESGEAPDEQALVRQALDHPIGTDRLEEIVRPGETVAILTSDPTRPMPTYKVLPALLDRLECAGIRPEDITVYIARGNHRATTEAERRELIGTDC